MVCSTSCVSTELPAPELVEISVSRKVDNARLSETVAGNVSGEWIEATTTFRRFLPEDRKRHEHWLGTDGGDPEYVVSSMSVTRGGEAIVVPYYIYSDFGDFAFQGGFLRILQSKSGFAVKHYGSDGAGSFDATFYFDEKGFDRVVINGGHGGDQHIRRPEAEQVETQQPLSAALFP
jgi:hypothetical protein